VIAFLLLLVVPLVACVAYFYAVMRVWRAEPMLALAMLIVWPVGVYVLVRYWKDEEAGLRLPLLVAFGLLAIWLGAVIHGASRAPQEDVDVEDVAQAVPAVPDDADALAANVRRAAGLHSLGGVGGRVDFVGAHASIEVPAHFRFIDRAALAKAYPDGAGDAQLLGWLVHEKVDLAAKDAWHVDVRRLADGWISDQTLPAQSRETLLAASRQAAAMRAGGEEDAAAYGFVGYRELPRLDADGHWATWVEELAPAQRRTSVLDCHAARLGRDGALLYTVAGMPPSRQELCLRAVRLMAARSGFEHGRRYTDRSRLLDRRAPYDLVGLVTGRVSPVRR